MDLIYKYWAKNEGHIARVFAAMAKQDKLEATKVFEFIQNAFNQEQFRFQLNGQNFFESEENEPRMQTLLQSYYRMQQQDESKKFYLYRIEFGLDNVRDILRFWLDREQGLKIVYIEATANSLVERGIIKLSQDPIRPDDTPRQQQNTKSAHEDNQFESDSQNLHQIISGLRSKVKGLEIKLGEMSQKGEHEQIKNQINELQIKLKVAEQRLKTQPGQNKKLLRQPHKNISQSVREQEKQIDSPTLSNKKITVNFKAIFQFYAKQTHLTGVKATFERIQHESQSVNYQKLVHFLREFNLLPEEGPGKKKLHAVYVKNCSSTRDLNYEGFMNVLDGVGSILWPGKGKNDKMDSIKHRIIEKNIKVKKILNNPFHSLEKDNFRIDVNDLSYNFRLKPQDGKFINEITESLQARRKNKQEQKLQKSKVKQQKNLRYLRKLQMIDPFSPLVIKNSKLLQRKSQSYEPVASLQNIQKYRDNSFNFQNMFGIDLNSGVYHQVGQNPRRNSSFSRYDQSYGSNEKINKKVEKFEKYQAQKMKNLMSGIIQRSNAKLQKLGLSPNRQQKTSKYL